MVKCLRTWLVKGFYWMSHLHVGWLISQTPASHCQWIANVLEICSCFLYGRSQFSEFEVYELHLNWRLCSVSLAFSAIQVQYYANFSQATIREVRGINGSTFIGEIPICYMLHVTIRRSSVCQTAHSANLRRYPKSIRATVPSTMC